ncbi:hypothetical protein E1176_15145 [Fulvivirga sp. RKSG066]|uniref:hypothetical protein n=1 Tax=Fulvivirga aurantia TaxID=2529383 RepID=UPI0012BCC7D4|nr:hypothetical protein [Fulvivirga aurantia]MTI22367.1 hypothetical protein [Fulvivirga aurantia]
MHDRSRKYEIESILRLAEALKGDEVSYQWLKENNFKELAALSDVILHDSKSAKEWLQQYNFKALSALLSALNNDKLAFRYLLYSDFKEWAAVYRCIYKDNEALEWLARYNYSHYGYLAHVLHTLQESNQKGTYFYKLSNSDNDMINLTFPSISEDGHVSSQRMSASG